MSHLTAVLVNMIFQCIFLFDSVQVIICLTHLHR